MVISFFFFALVCFSDLTSTGLKSQCSASKKIILVWNKEHLIWRHQLSISITGSHLQAPGKFPVCSLSDITAKLPSGLLFGLSWQSGTPNCYTGRIIFASRGSFPLPVLWISSTRNYANFFMYSSNWLKNVDKLAFWWVKTLLLMLKNNWLD